MPGPSFSDSAVGAMAPLLGEFTHAQWNAVYIALSFGFTASGFATFFFWLQVPNMTKSYRVIHDTSSRRDHGTSTSDRVHRAGACRVLRGASTCCVRCASASGRLHHASTRGRVHRASACRVDVVPALAVYAVPAPVVKCTAPVLAVIATRTPVSTAPVAEPTVMSFTVPLTGSTIVATAAVVTMRSASGDCTDSNM